MILVFSILRRFLLSEAYWCQIIATPGAEDARGIAGRVYTYIYNTIYNIHIHVPYIFITCFTFAGHFHALERGFLRFMNCHH